jgi:hypothetical protein
VFLLGEILIKEGILEKNVYREGILEIFCKENHFSEEKSHELSHLEGPLTTHLCRLREGGFEQTTQ